MRSYSMKRRMRIEKKWNKIKSKAKPCPDCGCKDVGLNDCFMRRFKRFFLECEECHWCGKTYPTIRMAVRSWNRR